MNKLILGDSEVELKKLDDNSIDLTLTSPPYDNLRSYDKLSFEKFSLIAEQLFRITKDGGIVIWVVGDAVINGSETGTSFKQALKFKDIGFNIHDTMIYEKINYVPLNHNRYENAFEYMFCFSKGTPKTFNPIKIPCKEAGKHYTSHGDNKRIMSDVKQSIRVRTESICSDYKIHSNIFKYSCGLNKTGHPAPFPIGLCDDMILSWSNEGDTVLDPFMGGGTTGAVCKNLNRDFIGIELDENYFNIATDNIKYGIKFVRSYKESDRKVLF